MANTAEMTMVKIIILVPADKLLIYGNLANNKLITKLMMMETKMVVFCFAGGTMMARNIPYNATENALTICIGNEFPAIMPNDVPNAQSGMATVRAPYV